MKFKSNFFGILKERGIGGFSSMQRKIKVSISNAFPWSKKWHLKMRVRRKRFIAFTYEIYGGGWRLMVSLTPISDNNKNNGYKPLTQRMANKVRQTKNERDREQ